MQLTLPGIFPVSIKSAIIDNTIRKLVQYFHPLIISLFYTMVWIFVNPVLEFINNGYPWKNGDRSFQLVFLSSFKIFFINKEYFPVIHTKKLHCHTGNFRNFH